MRPASVILAVLPARLAAQAFDGVWLGPLLCDPILALTVGRLNATMRVTIEGSRVRYERPVITPEGRPTETAERGEGTVAPSGEVTVNGGAGGRCYAYTARYPGRAGDRIISLAGSQTWQPLNLSPRHHERPRTVTLARQ